MEINITDGVPTVVTITGRLYTVSSPDFEKAIAHVIAGDMKEVNIECSLLDYISSSGLRIFLTMQKTANSKKGRLVLKDMKPEIKEIFDMTGFSALFRFE